MSRARAYLVVILLLLAWAAIPDGPAASSEPSTEIPSCAEDAVLIGAGDFEQGRWDTYTCGPSVDDYEEGR